MKPFEQPKCHYHSKVDACLYWGLGERWGGILFTVTVFPQCDPKIGNPGGGSQDYDLNVLHQPNGIPIESGHKSPAS